MKGKVTNLPKAEKGSILESKNRILLVLLTNSKRYCRWSRAVGISEQNSWLGYSRRRFNRERT